MFSSILFNTEYLPHCTAVGPLVNTGVITPSVKKPVRKEQGELHVLKYTF